MRFHQTPALLTWLFPKIWWRKRGGQKTIYLTFDDGPIPEVTEFVLEQLRAYHAKATFFCVGDNVARHSQIAEKVLAAGHLLANHTFHHVQAWKKRVPEYRQDVERCQQVLRDVGAGNHSRKLFRPPHGQLTLAHLRMLHQEGYQVVMWSSLSYDFDAALPPEECLQKTIAASGPGSIVVLHDSLKAQRNLYYVLPRLLRHFATQGYAFKTL